MRLTDRTQAPFAPYCPAAGEVVSDLVVCGPGAPSRLKPIDKSGFRLLSTALVFTSYLQLRKPMVKSGQKNFLQRENDRAGGGRWRCHAPIPALTGVRCEAIFYESY
jgi:hypothetical protein